MLWVCKWVRQFRIPVACSTTLSMFHPVMSLCMLVLLDFLPTSRLMWHVCSTQTCQHKQQSQSKTLKDWFFCDHRFCFVSTCSPPPPRRSFVSQNNTKYSCFDQLHWRCEHGLCWLRSESNHQWLSPPSVEDV